MSPRQPPTATPHVPVRISRKSDMSVDLAVDGMELGAVRVRRKTVRFTAARREDHGSGDERHEQRPHDAILLKRLQLDSGISRLPGPPVARQPHNSMRPGWDRDPRRYLLSRDGATLRPGPRSSVDRAAVS